MFLFVTSGIWPRGADGTDINNCARSHDNQLMVSADDFGKVNMYRYPCSQPRVSIYIGTSRLFGYINLRSKFSAQVAQMVILDLAIHCCL